jgi:cyclohexanecarboxylate-CoA ligase
VPQTPAAGTEENIIRRTAYHSRVTDVGGPSRLDASGLDAAPDLASLVLTIPDRSDLVCFSDLRLSGADLRACVTATVATLKARGVGRGDAVAWQLSNQPEVVFLYLAAWWLGAIAAPFHNQLTAVEMGQALSRLPQKRVLYSEDGLPLSGFDGAEPPPPLWRAPSGDDEPLSYSQAIPDDIAVVLTTSGSSGSAKSVIHLQRTLGHKARQLPALHGTTMNDAVLVPTPLSHMAGVVHGVLHPLTSGVKAVVMSQWDAADAFALVRDERVTMLFGPPIFALGIADASGGDREAVSSVRLIASGGTAITESYLHKVRTIFDSAVKRTYGSTEAPIVTNTFPNDDPQRGWTTDGRAVPGVELELRPVEGGPALPPNVPGELWVRGSEVCAGYLDPVTTGSSFVDGWFRTRDIAVIDEEGFVRIVGRASDMIIRGGMNISASEVVAALEAHPEISQAAVVGYPDDVYGERVAAFIVSRSDLDRDECVRWFAAYGIAKYKVPDTIIRLDELPPLAGLQKPDLNALRRVAANRSTSAR